MVKEIKFSIIIATYNMADTILNAVNSITGQKYKNYEIIIYNDASTDNTYKILKKYKKENKYNIKIINGKKNIGLGASRNKAVEKARGTYILYLDADDTLYGEDTLEKINKVLEKNNPDIAYFGVKYIGGSNKTYIPNSENSTKKARILCDMHFAVSSKCWKREFLQKNQITFLKDMYYEDMVYSLKATILAKTIAYGEFPIYNYVRNGENSITRKPNLRKCTDMYKMLYHVLELYEITPEEYKPYLLSFIKQETQSIPHKIGIILGSYKKGISNPIFPKRQYTFNEKDEDVCV